MRPVRYDADGIMIPVNTLDNRALFPRHKECPDCYFNLVRYKIKAEIPKEQFLAVCPHCTVDLHGW